MLILPLFTICYVNKCGVYLLLISIQSKKKTGTDVYKKHLNSISVSASVSDFEQLRKVFCNHFPCRCKYLRSIYSQENSGSLWGACFNKNSISLE